MNNKNNSENLTFHNWKASNYTIPLLFIVALAFVFSTLLFIISRNALNEQANDLDLLAERYSKNIELKLNAHQDYLKLIASQRAKGNLSVSSFQARVSEYLKDHTEFINISWVDSTYTIKTVAPLQGNSHIIDLKIELDEPKRASRLAMKTKEAVYTKPFEAIQAESSFEVWFPIFRKGKFIGLFAGVYSCAKVLNNSIETENYEKTIFSLLDGDSNYISGAIPYSKRKNDIISQRELTFMNNGLKLQIQKPKLNYFNTSMQILISICIMLLIGFTYSLWVIQKDSVVRKKMQASLLKNKNLLKKQNEELIQAIEITKQSEAKFKAMIDTSPLAIIMSSGIDQKSEYINPSFSKLFGYTLDEVSTVLDWSLLAYPDETYRNKLTDEWQNKVKDAIINKTEIDPMETVVVCKDKSEKYISWGFVSTELQNWVFGLDLTKIKITQEKLYKAKEKAEESDRLKSAFLANMSHEIRTPMNGILGFADLLKTPNLTGIKQIEYIDIIEKSGVRMLSIINDIINISKIEAGLMDLNMINSDINKQLEYIYTFFKPEIEAKGLEFILKNQISEDKLSIKTDREKVYAILTNLVKNAIKFTKTGFIEIGCNLVNDTIEFYVKDSGIGIHEDMTLNIFERFIQADVNDKEAYQGTGLGLSISKSYVEMLGGEIWIESEFGLGSTFYFKLPYKSSEDISSSSQTISTSAENMKNIDPLKVLISEDDEASEMILSLAVEDYSNEVICVKNGQEAVDICRETNDIDLILMDIQMPIMNGYAATKEIRKFNKDVIIIAQTAYALEGDREKAIAAGCNDYITKPIKINVLNQLIKCHLKSKK